MEVIVNTYRMSLRHGEMICHEPGEFHNILGTDTVVANIVIISFNCSSGHMDFFADKIIPISDPEKKLMPLIIKEAAEAFSFRLDVVNL